MNFPILVHNSVIIILPLCGTEVKEDFLTRDIMHFKNMTNLAFPWGPNPKPRGHEFQNFGGGIIPLHNHTNGLVWS